MAKALNANMENVLVYSYNGIHKILHLQYIILTFVLLKVFAVIIVCFLLMLIIPVNNFSVMSG